jgi:hypothetical protein
VMSRIIPAFCSSVRPAAMLMVISGIVGLSLFATPIKQDVEARHKAGRDAPDE